MSPLRWALRKLAAALNALDLVDAAYREDHDFAAAQQAVAR